MLTRHAWGSCHFRRPMLDHLVLYLWYRPDCPVTADHLARLRAIEGPGRVLPLDVSGRPGAIDLGPYATEDRWQGPDAAVYRWARSRDFVPARRYLVVEWDTLATMPLRDWWGDACYEADLGVVRVATLGDGWTWWEHRSRLPGPVQPHAAGFCPYGGHVLSRRALTALAESDPVPGVFCELRAASYLGAAGITATVRPGGRKRTVWIGDTRLPSHRGPGVWHPVKGPVAWA